MEYPKNRPYIEEEDYKDLDNALYPVDCLNNCLLPKSISDPDNALITIWLTSPMPVLT